MRKTGEWGIMSVDKGDKLVGYCVAGLQKGVMPVDCSVLMA